MCTPCCNKEDKKKVSSFSCVGRGWLPCWWALCKVFGPLKQWQAGGRGCEQSCLHIRKGQESLVSLFKISVEQGQKLLYDGKNNVKNNRL